MSAAWHSDSGSATSSPAPRRSARSTSTPAEEESRARRGLLPRSCYVPSLFGCFDYEQEIRYCAECPWKKWRPGEWFKPAGDADEEDKGE